MTAIKQNERTSLTNSNKHIENTPDSTGEKGGRLKKNPISNAFDAEKARFFDAVSGVVSMLVQQHGYSRPRANSLVLAEIRQNDEHPTENEIFNMMKYSNIGMDDARRAATVARAFKRSYKSTKESKVDAIRLLTSQLETSTFLNKITYPSNFTRPSKSDSVPDFKSLLNDRKTKDTSESNHSLTSQSKKSRNSTQRTSKSKSSLRSVSLAKAQRKRQLSIEENKDHVDVAVEKKALKDPINSESCHRTLSPSQGITRKRNTPDGQGQPPMKRSRCDSV